MRTRALVTIGKPIEKDEWVICLSADSKRFVIPCGAVPWTVPCYGKELHIDEVKEMISFLQHTLKEMEGHEQRESNLE